MSKPLSRLAALVATAALAVSMSACTAGQWVYDSAPAAGVQADNGGLKLRNVLVLTDGSKATLLGAVASRDSATQVTGIQVAAEDESGAFGAPAPVEFQADIAKGKTVILDGTETAIDGASFVVGRLADVRVDFSPGESVQLKVPVYSSEHADFVDAWKTANA